MDSEIRDRFNELKAKREQLFELRTESKQIKKQLISNSVSESNWNDQISELERKLKKSSFSKFIGRINENALSSELESAKIKLSNAKERSRQSYERSQQIAQKLEELGTIEIDYNNQIKVIGSHLNDESSNRKLQELDNLDAKTTAATSAFELGIEIDKALEEITNKLWQSREAGFIDLIGGGIVVDSLKYSKLKSSKNHLDTIKDSIEKYVLELEKLDINLTTPSETNITGTTKFSDYIFDGIIFDSIVLNKIQTMLDQYNILQKRVKRTQQHLIDIIEDFKRSTESLQAEIIETANF
jgi:hypothetical protein